MSDSVNFDSNGKFKEGNKFGGARPGAGRKSKKFKDEAAYILEGMLEEFGTDGLTELKKIIVGYKGVTPAHKLDAIKTLLAYVHGKPTEHIVSENYNTEMKGYSKEELIKMVFGDEKKDLEAKNDGRAGTSPSGTGEA